MLQSGRDIFPGAQWRENIEPKCDGTTRQSQGQNLIITTQNGQIQLVVKILFFKTSEINCLFLIYLNEMFCAWKE